MASLLFLPASINDKSNYLDNSLLSRRGVTICNSDSLILDIKSKKKSRIFVEKYKLKKLPDTQYKMRVNLEL